MSLYGASVFRSSLVTEIVRYGSHDWVSGGEGMSMLDRWVVTGRPRSRERLLGTGKLKGTGLTL